MKLYQNEKPLPCPFCGRTPQVWPTRPDLDGNAWGRVQCVAKSCVARPSVDDNSRIADERGSDAYKQLAIRRWNRGICKARRAETPKI